VQRFGSVLLLLSVVAAIGHYVTRLTPPLQGLAEESLLVYAVHVALLYGSHWTTGLGPALGPQPPRVVLGWALVMLAAMTLMALIWNNIERLHPRLAVACRATAVVALVYKFV
jgi:peptidoglycan/LPS O-acetylase OafA/YrhL